LSKEARLDLAAWSLFLESYNGTSLLINDLWESSEKLELFTDASGLGFAGILARHVVVPRLLAYIMANV
jgi:hypothetical protein